MLLEIYQEGRWIPCARLELGQEGDGRGAPVRVAYEPDYAVANLDARDHRALSCRYRVSLAPVESHRWPAFLVDLLPQGAARRRLQRLAGRGDDMSEWELLLQGAWNPVGNVRVSGAPAPNANHPGFSLADVTGRGVTFIDYASDVGAWVAGATDTQGEAPKFWLIRDAGGRFHPDAGHLDAVAEWFALIKFPVPEAGRHAEVILRNEAAYQRVAKACGFRTTAELPRIDGGALIVPRFDRRRREGVVERLGVESIYSITNTLDAGANLFHERVVLDLHAYVDDFDGELREYVGRDVLNLALGNRDNHGRNTAVLKDVDGTVRLAPIYDFGPSYLDARGVARAITWHGAAGHRIDWNKTLLDLETRANDEGIDIHEAVTGLRAYLLGLGERMNNLPDVMRREGVDDFIIEARISYIQEVAGDLRLITPQPTFNFGL